VRDQDDGETAGHVRRRLTDVPALGAAHLQPGEQGRHVVDGSGHERAHLRTAVQAVVVAYETGLISRGGDAPARP
jgi:hypothetical protein